MGELYSTMPQFSNEYAIEVACAYIEYGESSTETMAHVLLALIDPEAGECMNIDYEYAIEEERRTEWDARAVVAGYRQWTYQRCAQLGWFHNSGSPDQPFGDRFPIDVFHGGCAAVFNDGFTAERLQRNSDRFNTIYGGLEPDVTNAVFVYGEHDPWSVLGRRTDLNGDAVVEGATMGNDLGPAADADSEALAEAKEQIAEIIQGWLSD